MIDQCGGDAAGGALACAEQLCRTGIDQPHAIVAVNDYDAFTQVLDDVFIKLGKVGEINAPLSGERFAELNAPR